MEISTGYFAKAKLYHEFGYALVSIAKVPPWFLDKDLVIHSLPELAPTEEILALKDKPEDYEDRYRSEILSKASGMGIYNRLASIAKQMNTDRVVLLCYETPEKFCHRHIVARWLEYCLGHSVLETHIEPNRIPSLFDSDV